MKIGHILELAYPKIPRDERAKKALEEKALDLSDFGIDELPEEFAATFPALQVLHLESNDLEILPPLPKGLVALYIDENRLILFQNEWAHLLKLQVLSLKGNKISFLCPDRPFPSLWSLSLRRNPEFDSAWTGWGHFPLLRQLDLSWTRIPELPDLLSFCPHLSWLNLRHCGKVDHPKWGAKVQVLTGTSEARPRVETAEFSPRFVLTPGGDRAISVLGLVPYKA
jgi:Leucine-rich repeat (LRR) protein